MPTTKRGRAATTCLVHAAALTQGVREHGRSAAVVRAADLL